MADSGVVFYIMSGYVYSANKYYKACDEIFDTIHNIRMHRGRKTVNDIAQSVFDGIIVVGAELAMCMAARMV